MNISIDIILGLAKDAYLFIRKRVSNEDTIARLRKQHELKAQFEQKLGLSPQYPLKDPIKVLLRNIDRANEYPEDKIKNPDKTWPFFKTELRGLYHQGIEVYNAVVGFEEQADGLYINHYGSTNDENGYLIARVPFDWIDHVDFDGDEYDFTPHIFCRFKRRGLPYCEMHVERMIMNNGKVAGTRRIGVLDTKTNKVILQGKK